MRQPGGRCLALLFIINTVLFLGSCNTAEEDTPQDPPAPESTPEADPFLAWRVGETPEEITTRVQEVLAKSRELTEEIPLPPDSTDTLPHRAPKPFPIAVRAPRPVPPLREDPPDPIGRLVTRDAEPTWSLAVSNDGTVFQSTPNGVTAWPLDGESFPFSEHEAIQLQIDAASERLLLHAKGMTQIFSGDEFTDIREIEGDLPGERFYFYDTNQLLITHEAIDFAAASRMRIMLESFLYDIETGQWENTGWNSAGRFSALGTLPAQDVVWSHRVTPYKINAMPAPLVSLDNGRITGYLTRTEEAADLTPSADRIGRLYWLRTRKRGSDTGRAMYRMINGDLGSEVQLTGRPTYAIAISPNGEHGAFVIRKDERFELRRFRSIDLETESPKFARFREQDEALRVKALTALEDLRAALVQSAGAAPTEETDYGLILKEAPDEALVAAMTDALKRVFIEHFDISLSTNVAGLAEVDAVLDVIETYWPEEPATVLALGGYFAEAFPAPAQWDLSAAAEYVTISFEEITDTSDIGYSAVLPFAAARERLTNERALAPLAANLARTLPRPIYFTENLSPVTTEDLLMREYNRAGLPGKQAQLLQLFDQLSEMDPPNAALADLAHRQARHLKQPTLKLYTAWHLARSRPESGRALKELGDALWETYNSEIALEVLREAAMLLPEDINVRLNYADALLGMSQLDAAEAELGRVSVLDRSAVLASDVRERIKLIEKLRAEREQ